MCRNIKTLFNFDPPATEIEIRDASLQFVRKLSGFTLPPKATEAAFERAVEIEQGLDVAAHGGGAGRCGRSAAAGWPPKDGSSGIDVVLLE